MLREMCNAYANTLEVIRMSSQDLQSDFTFGIGDFGFNTAMPISRKNTDPQSYAYYLQVGD